MSRKLIIIVGSIYFLAVIIFGIYIYWKDKFEKSGRYISFYKKRKHHISETIYRYMLRFPLTRDYIEKISRRYEMLCPGRPGDIAKKTMSLTAWAFGISSVILLIIYKFNPGIQDFVLAAYLVYVTNNELINYTVTKAEIELRMEQEKFVSNIGRNFFTDYYIDDAILRTMEETRMSNEMRVHAQAIYDITISDNMHEAVELYNATTHDKFMKMLLSLCVNIIERSDGSREEKKILASNLLNLKKEINLDYLKQKKLQFVFSGSVFVAVIVCTPLRLIQNFGIYISPELTTFYRGILGIIYVATIFITSFATYLLINNAKEVKRPRVKDHRKLERIEKLKLVKIALENFNEKNYRMMHNMKDTLKRLGDNITPNQLLIKCSLIGLTTFMFCIAFVFAMNFNTKNLLLKNADGIDTLSTVATEDQLSLVKETVLYYTDKYKSETITQDELREEITNQKQFQSGIINEKVAQEIFRRIEKYKKENFMFYDLLICIAISAIASFLPFLSILYRKKLMHGAMEDEVVQFKSIIYMMMNSAYITVADILEQMEIFAVVFKTTIRECLNEYNSGDIEALERMRDRETNESFKHLVSNLIRCDEMPIAQAFEEIAADRENYFERRKQEEDFSIQRKADSIKPLAYLPGILVLVYLILPVLAVSLKSIRDVSVLLKETGLY